jgi:signal transduction histidine kinase
MEPTTLDPTKGVWARAASEDKALVLTSPIDNQTLRSHYEAMGIKDMMISPMHADDDVNGLILVFNKQGQSETFRGDDLRLFETLANHASIAIQNARLIAQLEDSLVHLTQMNSLKDDFVASVSHELRTPLTSIQGYVKTLLREDTSFSAAEQRSFLETVDRQSGRLHRLIEDLLAVSRIESRTDATHYSMASVRQVVLDVVDEVRDKVSADQVKIDFDGDLPAETDAGKVHQILANLVDNALKYGGQGKPIVIRGRPDGEGVSVAVIDQGPGVPAELQDMVFDRFYQIDQSATRSVGGAGLGLYICRRMAEAVGGRVWLEKTGPDGSTFTLWVPVSPNQGIAPLIQTTEGSWKL